MNLSLIMKSKNIILAVNNHKRKDILRDAKTNKSYPLILVAQSRKSTYRNRNGIIMKKLNDKLKLVTEKIRKRSARSRSEYLVK